MKLPKYFTLGIVLCAMALSFAVRSIDIANYPYLLDGDPYFHASIIRSIISTHHLPQNTPYQIPLTPLFYPLGFHVVFAVFSIVTRIPDFVLMRWGGPAMAALLTLGIYILARRLRMGQLGAAVAATVSALLPYFTQRFSITLPEELLLLVVVAILTISTYLRPGKRLVPFISMFVLASFGMVIHFSGYLIFPILGLSGLWLLWHYVRERRWMITISYIVLFLVVIIGVIKAFPGLVDVLRSFSNTAVNNPEFMPQPSWRDWISAYGQVTVILGTAGFALVLYARKRTRWAITILWTITGLCFLDFFPRFHIYNLLPARAFAYVGIPLVLFVGLAITRLRRFTILVPIVSILAIILTTPIHAAGWDHDVTTGEYRAMIQLKNNASTNLNATTLVVTQPINGRTIGYYTQLNVVSDAARPYLYDTTTSEFLTHMRSFGQYDQYYVYISKYKLSDRYNVGWTRPWAAVGLHLSLFKSPEFTTVYEDSDAVVYKFIGE